MSTYVLGAGGTLGYEVVKCLSEKSNVKAVVRVSNLFHGIKQRLSMLTLYISLLLTPSSLTPIFRTLSLNYTQPSLKHSLR